ncbi:Solute carrier family 25 (Mitochondrial phosphate transporter) [Forsythia ovata]|uniref:Solute carrier family 25 (Mitochondrial phosphate transporter) n=1 Tax=Forsythia ovata TaxID=205694 RepID=A0ABD1VG89_9LAMI
MEVSPTIPTGPEAPDMSGDQVPAVQPPHETEPEAEGHGGGETINLGLLTNLQEIKWFRIELEEFEKTDRLLKTWALKEERIFGDILMASEDVKTSKSAVSKIVNLAEEAKLAKEEIKPTKYQVYSVCKSLIAGGVAGGV